MMGQLSGMQRAGGYENLAQVIESALALKNLIDAAHREGYTVLVMQTPRGKQRRMQYHP